MRTTSGTPTLDEAVGRLVAIIRRDRPQVIVTYGDDQRHYAHPDHLQVHDITLPAFDRAGDPDWYPEAGRAVAAAEALLHRLVADPDAWRCTSKFEELGIDSPFAEDWIERIHAGEGHDRITTQDRHRRLLRRARGGPAGPRHAGRPRRSPFWFGLPTEVARDVHPFDDYILARSLVDTSPPEDDLFAGVPGR